MRSFEKHHKGVVCNGCNDRLQDATEYLRKWFIERKEKLENLHVSWAHRDEAWQNQAFANGDSKLNWPRSKHNKLPAQALDLFQIDDNGKAFWNPMTYAKINEESASDGWTLRWGGTFKSLGDYCHFETIEG